MIPAEGDPAPFHGTAAALWEDIAGRLASASYHLGHAVHAAQHADTRGYLYFFRLVLADVKAAAASSKDLMALEEGRPS